MCKKSAPLYLEMVHHLLGNTVGCSDDNFRHVLKMKESCQLTTVTIVQFICTRHTAKNNGIDKRAGRILKYKKG